MASVPPESTAAPEAASSARFEVPHRKRREGSREVDPGPPDHALVSRAQSGDRQALGELVRRYGPELRFALEGRAGNAELASDVAQEAWVRAAKGMGGFRVGQRFRPWLFAIGFNTLRDHYRSVGLRPETGAATLYEDDRAAPRHGDFTDAAAEREAITLALELVEEPYQSALRLVDVLGLEYAEAAEALGCAPGTVKSRISRGRKAFRAGYERLVGLKTPGETGPGGPTNR